MCTRKANNRALKNVSRSWPCSTNPPHRHVPKAAQKDDPMKNHLAPGLLVVAVLCGSSSTASAQEQTIEGAQKFLSMALPGNPYQSPFFTTAFEAWGSSERQYKYSGAAPVTEAVVAGHCRTTIRHDITGLFVQTRQRLYDISEQGRWSYWNHLPTHNFYPAERVSGAIASDEISWADVKEVKANGAQVLFLQNGHNHHTALNLGAADMAARVAYAMEFLRVSCDKTAGTGF